MVWSSFLESSCEGHWSFSRELELQPRGFWGFEALALLDACFWKMSTIQWRVESVVTWSSSEHGVPICTHTPSIHSWTPHPWARSTACWNHSSHSTFCILMCLSCCGNFQERKRRMVNKEWVGFTLLPWWVQMLTSKVTIYTLSMASIYLVPTMWTQWTDKRLSLSSQSLYPNDACQKCAAPTYMYKMPAKVSAARGCTLMSPLGPLHASR